MEVHHHTHHPKKISEYFTEFLMLFLAVTLGFLAENLRESYVEKERAHELIFQLKTDIQNNIKLIDSVVLRDQSLVREFDTAVVYLTSNELINGDSLYANMPPNVYRFLSKNDTYDQMKNSGSLRYIKDTLLLSKILNYASDCAAAEARSSSMEVDFVSTEFTNVIDYWMPNSTATKRMFNERSGENVIINRETTSKKLIDPIEIKFLSIIKKINKDPLYDKIKSNKIRSSLLPVLSRRTALLINTVRFMGVAKQSGQALIDYINKTEQL